MVSLCSFSTDLENKTTFASYSPIIFAQTQTADTHQPATTALATSKFKAIL